MEELKLAQGESVVRSYECVAVDGCRVVAGTAIPGKFKGESKGTITITDKRVIYTMESTGSKGGSIHQETRISDITSISSVMAKFGRDIRMPVLMIVLGFLLMFAPYVYATENGLLDDEGDYSVGYNFGVEYGYYMEYLEAIEDGDVKNTIPAGYILPETDDIVSSDYMKGAVAGMSAGANRASQDVSAKKDFSVPTDLMLSNDDGRNVLICAVAGAIVFIMGSVLYAISSRTKDWVRIGFGMAGSQGIAIKSISGGSDKCAIGPLNGDQQFYDVVSEIGSVILNLKSNKPTGLNRGAF